VMSRAWNAIVMGDLEKELTEQQRRQFHIILGRRSDGSLISFRFQGALSDALAMFDLADVDRDVQDIISEKKSIVDLPIEAGKSLVNRVASGLSPYIKVPIEAVSGRSWFPDVFARRLIRDRAEHILQQAALERPYRWIAGKPVRGGKTLKGAANEALSMFTTTSDPGEQAYNEMRAKSYDWLGEKKLARNFEPDDKANALYYYKKAVTMGDPDAAARYLKQYASLGGTLKGIAMSIERSKPLSNIPTALLPEFYNSLSAKEKERVGQAYKWWKRTYYDEKPLEASLRKILEEQEK